MGLPPRHMINPRPTRFVSGKAIEYRGRPRRYDVDPSSGWREVARVDALINEVFWTPWGDEYKNSYLVPGKSCTNLNGNIIQVLTLISISNVYYICGQSDTWWYNSSEQSTRYHNVRRRLSLCFCYVPVYLVFCRTSRYALRLETTHYV